MITLPLWLIFAANPPPPHPAEAPLPEKIEFNKHIRPIFSDTCFHCHGPDAHEAKGKLQLHDFLHATKPLDSDASLRAIVPGKPEDSEALKRIFSDDPDELMPPPDSHKVLSERQKELVKKWISQGATYQDHWSYQKVVRPAALPAQTAKAADLLIAKGLKEAGIAASPAASREQLIRRLAFDLTGLPPKAALLKKYLADQAPDALDRCADELIAAPAFGERLAVHWMDVVRAAGTAGFHGDQDQPLSPYRDYIIRAFNQDKPFDQFTREQLAGDLLKDGDEDARIASCYNRLNAQTKEGGAQPGEYLAKYQADRVRNTAQAWLGSTLGCAECHNHKYDPFTQKDFYAFGAFFADLEDVGVYNVDIFGKNSGNNDSFQPELIAGLPKAEAQVQEKLWAVRKNQLAATRAAVKKAGTPCPIETIKADEGSVFAVQPDGSVLAGKTAAGTENLHFSASLPAGTRYLRLRFKPLPGGKGHSFAPDGNFYIHRFAVKNAEGKPQAVAAYAADAWNPSFHPNHLQSAGQAHHSYGWSPGPEMPGEDHVLLVELKKELGGKVEFLLECNSSLSQQIPVHFSLECSPADETYKNARAELDKTESELSGFRKKGGVPVMNSRSVEPRQVRLLNRGNWMDLSGEVMQAAPPACVPPALPAAKKLNRLDLAEWMLSSENPLTARVFVNRIWALYMGAPLSAKAGDFGSQGEFPSNPELLDLLAADFMKDWSVKNLVRAIVRTEAYRRSCAATPEQLAADPKNRLYGRQSPRRLESEFIRDHALALSGLLVDVSGGRASYPYQPAGFYASLNFPTREYPVSQDDQQWRRGVYMHWQRTFLHPFLQNFDAPNRQDCTPLRARSNTPLQALSLLNDPQFVEAASFFAQRIEREAHGDDETRIRWAVKLALGREAAPDEVAALLKVRQLDLASYAKDPAAAAKLLGAGIARRPWDADAASVASWTGVARALINSSEFITVY
ncbi:MAG: hypothetical protein RL095_605 [Verrucomicrobiota bacterium]|jgi:mono/diheme cytochrome c family protein